jgi:bisphosphoglycerate-independent phosphoglycerate mutase (AlkP superfamily)
MKKILTIILDGFGIRDEEKGNAIKQAIMNWYIESSRTEENYLKNVKATVETFWVSINIARE